MTQASVYSRLKQDRIDRGEAPGLSAEGQIELAAAKSVSVGLRRNSLVAEGQRGPS